MKKNYNSVDYIRGLMKGADVGNERLTEVLNLILNAIENQDSEMQKLAEQMNDLDEYVESIDDALSEMEEMLDDFNDDLLDDEDVDFDEDEHPLRLVKKDHECEHHHHKEGHHCHDDEGECDCDDDDDDVSLDGFDNLFLGAMCPECNRLFCVTDEDFDDPKALYHCPYCGKDVHISPIDPKNVPIAERVNR